MPPMPQRPVLGLRCFSHCVFGLREYAFNMVLPTRISLSFFNIILCTARSRRKTQTRRVGALDTAMALEAAPVLALLMLKPTLFLKEPHKLLKTGQPDAPHGAMTPLGLHVSFYASLRLSTPRKNMAAHGLSTPCLHGRRSPPRSACNPTEQNDVPTSASAFPGSFLSGRRILGGILPCRRRPKRSNKLSHVRALQ